MPFDNCQLRACNSSMFCCPVNLFMTDSPTKFCLRDFTTLPEQKTLDLDYKPSFAIQLI